MEQFQVIDHCLMVKLPEEVDHHLSQYLCKRADEYLMQKEVNNIIFDFEDTVFMDSSGIGILMGRYRKINLIGGKIYLIHVSPQIQRVLKISGVLRYISLLQDKKKEEGVC